MVVKRRVLLAAAWGSALLASSAAPVLGAFGAAKPDPLTTRGLIRVQDIAVVRRSAGVGPVVALGWREASKPGELFLTFSTNAGRSYRRPNGNLRRFRVAGVGTRGMSVDVCGGRVWAASIASFPGDDKGDFDVLLSSRTVGGGTAAQAFISDASVDRNVRSVSMTCIGNRLLAVAWLERSNGRQRGQLFVRSLEPLGQAAAVRRVFGLGSANLGGGISVDASNETVHVAWTADSQQNLYHRRFTIGSGKKPDIQRRASRRLAVGGIRYPKVGARGNRLVVAYSDGGQLRARVSSNDGVQFAQPEVLVSSGRVRTPSRAQSATIAGDRIVVEANASKAGEYTPQRIQSNNGGQTWNARVFGNVGARVGALWSAEGATHLVEAWQNNSSGPDTLRAQYER
jgi:hypothetical protein